MPTFCVVDQEGSGNASLLFIKIKAFKSIGQQRCSCCKRMPALDLASSLFPVAVDTWSTCKFYDTNLPVMRELPVPFRFTKTIAEDERAEQGAILLLVSLGIFFFASLVLYAIYVVRRVGSEAGAIIPFHLPPSFILTTVALIAISVLLHLAVTAVRRERQSDFRLYILIAFCVSLLFFAIQGVGLYWMIQQLLGPFNTMTNLYGFTLFLVLVHALHVIGGVAGLTLIFFGIAKNRYDHERNFPVRFCALYWHFLDAVWIVMLACFALAAYSTSV